MYSLTLKDIWVSFLEMTNRFLNNRFQHHPNETVEVLKLELERERVANNKLLSMIQALTAKPVAEVPVEDFEEIKPVGRESWKVKAARLSHESFLRKQELDKAKAEFQLATGKLQTVEDIERELSDVSGR